MVDNDDDAENWGNFFGVVGVDGRADEDDAEGLGSFFEWTYPMAGGRSSQLSEPWTGPPPTTVGGRQQLAHWELLLLAEGPPPCFHGTSLKHLG